MNHSISIHHFYLFGFFLFCNFCTPLMSDDIYRSFLSILEQGRFWEQMWIDFQNWTGRMSAQALVYLFFNKNFNFISLPILHIVNSFLWVYLFDRFYFFIQILQNTNDRKNFGIFVGIFLVFLHYTGFAPQFLWKTIALQYFWGFCLWLYWIDQFFLKEKNNLLLSTVIGFLLGLYNEIFAFHLLTIAGLIFIFFRKHAIKTIFLKNGLYFSMGLLLGFLIFLSAPGNFKRLSVEKTASLTLWELFIEKIQVTDFAVVFYLSILTIFFTTYRLLRHYSIENKLLPFLILFHLSALVIIIFIISRVSVMTTRLFIFWGLIVFFIFYFYLSYFIQKIPSNSLIKMNYLFTSIGCILLFLMSYSYFDLFQFQKQREQFIQQALVKNQKEINLPLYKPIHKLRRFIFLNDISNLENDNINHFIAQYYGFEKVLGVEK